MTGWRVVGRIGAIVLIAIFVPLTGVLLLAHAAQQAIRQGDFLQDAFDDSRPFEYALAEAADGLAVGVPHDPETRDLPIARLDEQDWEVVLRTMLPPQDLQSWAQHSAQGLQDWLRTGEPPLEDLILPFGQVQENLFADPDLTVLRTITLAQPACLPGQSPLAEPTPMVPSCRPDDAMLEGLYAEVAAAWQREPARAWTQLWPEGMRHYAEDTSLREFIQREGGLAAGEVHLGWRWTRWGLSLATGLLQGLVVLQGVILLGLVVILAARSWAEALRWVGAPVALAGLFSVGLGLMALAGAAFGSWIAVPSQHAWIDVDTLTGGITQALGHEIWGRMSLPGSILTLAGLIVWFSSLFIPAPRGPSAQTVSAKTEETSEDGGQAQG